jgi:hypothetical protein
VVPSVRSEAQRLRALASDKATASKKQTGRWRRLAAQIEKAQWALLLFESSPPVSFTVRYPAEAAGGDPVREVTLRCRDFDGLEPLLRGFCGGLLTNLRRRLAVLVTEAERILVKERG